MKIVRNVRLRLTLWYTVVLAYLLVVFSIIVYALLSTNLNQQMGKEIKLRAAHLSDIINTASDGGLSGDIVIDTNTLLDFQIQNDEIAQFYALDGKQSFSLGLQVHDGQSQPLVARALQGEYLYVIMPTIGAGTVRVYVEPVLNGSTVTGAILIGRSTDNIMSVLQTYRNVAFIGVIMITILIGSGGFFLTSQALRPVRHITRVAREIGEGDLSQRIEVSYGDEIGVLAATLNNMFDRLQAAFTRERRFTSDASHELRTPLAIIQAEATLTLEKPRSTQEYKDSLGVITQEATHMSSVISNLLFLARGEAGKEVLSLEPIELSDFVNNLAEDISVLCYRKRLKLELGQLDPAVIQGDNTMLRQLFLNLFENAIRYTPPRGTISVAVTRQEDMAVVKITDTGVGISLEDQQHIFEPFFRVAGGKPRTSQGGSGLGLAIGQRIADALGGRIEVESQVNKGSSFSVLLPVDQAAQQDITGRPAKAPRKIKMRYEKPFPFFFWKW